MTAAPTLDASVVIPTLNRPDPLARALRSVCGQNLHPTDRVEAVVVDNSADQSARDVTARFLDAGPMPVRYVSEPAPGVSNARNRGVAEARGAFVAFLDDDEEADPGWLARHLATLRSTGADASFGPVEAAADHGGELGPFARYFSRAFARPDQASITDLAAFVGTNNSVFHAARCFDGPTPFAPELNSVGGEDSLLLQRLVRSGRTLAWAAEARVVEWVPDRRLTWAYVRQRRFLSGQIRCFVLDMLRPRPRLEIAKWMAAGAIQAGLYGALAMALTPVARDRARHAGVTARGGLGKVFWAGRFRPELYGAGLVSASRGSSATA